MLKHVNPCKKLLPIIVLLYAIFIFSIPFETLGIGTGDYLSLTKLIGYAFFVSCIIFQPKLCFGKPPKAFWFFVIYLFIYGFMGIYQSASYHTEIIARGFTTAQVLILMWISFNLMRNKKVAGIAFLSLAIPCGVISILQILNITLTDYYLDSTSLSVLGEDPNMAGSALAIGAVALIGVILTMSLSTR